MTEKFPLLLDAETLHQHLSDPKLVIIDMDHQEDYVCGHVPGALQLDFARIVSSNPPAAGLLPDEDQFSHVLSELGVQEDSHVVAYDRSGGLQACRLLWTLSVFGFENYSLLNGGLDAWVGAGLAQETTRNQVTPSRLRLRNRGRDVRQRDEIVARLDHEDVVFLDARSADEYAGRDVRSRCGGHIPGAVHYEWSRAIDPADHQRFRPAAELRQELESLGVLPEKEIIVYCQTHRRSCVSYIMLKSLGYPTVSGYPGAWSDWGNRPGMPLETGE